MPPFTSAEIAALAPAGALRAAINLGNAVLAARDPTTGEARGVAVDLARALAERLGVPLACLVVDTAQAAVEAVSMQRADVGFFAIDPKRGDDIAFTAPYLLIEGCYLVREDSPLNASDEVDRAGVRVVVGRGSAYDLFLTRTLAQATIERAPTSQAVVAQFLATGADVAAGVKQQLLADAAHRGGLRLLPGRFMLIEQAMGLPKARGAAAHRALARFVDEMKASGLVGELLARHGITGVTIAAATQSANTRS